MREMTTLHSMKSYSHSAIIRDRAAEEGVSTRPPNQTAGDCMQVTGG